MTSPNVTPDGFVYCIADPDTKRPRFVGTTRTTAPEAMRTLLSRARKSQKEGPVYDWIRSLGDRDPIAVRLSDEVPINQLQKARHSWIFELERRSADLFNPPRKKPGSEESHQDAVRIIEELNAQARAAA
jgi:hypothetical protein